MVSPKGDITDSMLTATGAPTQQAVTNTDNRGKNGQIASRIWGKNLKVKLHKTSQNLYKCKQIKAFGDIYRTNNFDVSRGFAASRDILTGSFGKINNMEYSINAREGEDLLPSNEYRGSLASELVLIHVVANWQLANTGFAASRDILAGSFGTINNVEYSINAREGEDLLPPNEYRSLLADEPISIYVVGQWWDDNGPSVDSLRFIIPQLRVIYRDIYAALLHVVDRTGRCHGNVILHSIKMIYGNAFVSCHLADWTGTSIGTPKEFEEVTYFI
ncbi:hypothetical protein GBA52_016713 [Prunus armeniaca]|nr:hypothetical protein GBA52_016713 [Prunus armeniaca]